MLFFKADTLKPKGRTHLAEQVQDSEGYTARRVLLLSLNMSLSNCDAYVAML